MFAKCLRKAAWLAAMVLSAGAQAQWAVIDEEAVSQLQQQLAQMQQDYAEFQAQTRMAQQNLIPLNGVNLDSMAGKDITTTLVSQMSPAELEQIAPGASTAPPEQVSAMISSGELKLPEGMDLQKLIAAGKMSYDVYSRTKDVGMSAMDAFGIYQNLTSQMQTRAATQDIPFEEVLAQDKKMAQAGVQGAGALYSDAQRTLQTMDVVKSRVQAQLTSVQGAPGQLAALQGIAGLLAVQADQLSTLITQSSYSQATTSTEAKAKAEKEMALIAEHERLNANLKAARDSLSSAAAGK